jgi:precorrin-2/cobalt-factor-2 C20-methyltransferase
VGLDEALSGLVGIGVGPGDPELVTLKAARLIGELPVLAHIGADGRASRARRIVADLIPPGIVELTADMPMRCAPQAAHPVYDNLADRIAAEIGKGRAVGFLCEGDPLLYGSFVAILDRLGSHVPVTVVPGITSVAAAAARTRHVLSSRDEVVTILPATAGTDRLEAALAAADSVALLKVGRHLPRIRALLEKAGLAAQAQVVTELGSPSESIQPLAKLEDERLPYFALILARRPRVSR